MPMCQNHVTDFAPVGKCHDCDTDRVELAYWEDKVASLTIQRDAAEALARERAIHLEDAKKGAADAANTARRSNENKDDAEARFVECERVRKRDRESLMRDMDRIGADVVAAKSDRDAAQQMVAEMRCAADDAVREAYNRGISDGHPLAGRPKGVADIMADLDKTSAPIAGRWCLASDTVSHDVHERVKALWLKRFTDVAHERDEALAILRAFVAAEDTQMVKAKGSGAAHLGVGMYSDAMDRARKLVGTP